MESPDPISAFFLGTAGTAATATAAAIPSVPGLFGLGGAITGAHIGTALSLGGTGLSAISGVRSAEAGKQAAKLEARQESISEGIRQRGIERKNALILGNQKNIGAASGLDITTGSPLELMLDTAREAEREKLESGYSSELRRRRSLYDAGLSGGKKTGAIGEGIFRGGSLLYQFAQRSKGVRV